MKPDGRLKRALQQGTERVTERKKGKKKKHTQRENKKTMNLL